MDRSIDTGYLPHTCKYPCNDKSVRETNHWPSNGGAWRQHWYLACYLLLYICPTSIRRCRKIRLHHSTLKYFITFIVHGKSECLALGRVTVDYAGLRVHLSIVCPLTTLPCNTQPTSKPEQYQVYASDTRGMWCDASFFGFDVGVVYASPTLLSHTT